MLVAFAASFVSLDSTLCVAPEYLLATPQRKVLTVNAGVGGVAGELAPVPIDPQRASFSYAVDLVKNDMRGMLRAADPTLPAPLPLSQLAPGAAVDVEQEQRAFEPIVVGLRDPGALGAALLDASQRLRSLLCLDAPPALLDGVGDVIRTMQNLVQSSATSRGGEQGGVAALDTSTGERRGRRIASTGEFGR